MANTSKRRHAEMNEVLETAQDVGVRAPMTEHTYHIYDVVGSDPPAAVTYADMLDALASEFRESPVDQ